jgi:hypothetical protein
MRGMTTANWPFRDVSTGRYQGSSGGNPSHAYPTTSGM